MLDQEALLVVEVDPEPGAARVDRVKNHRHCRQQTLQRNCPDVFFVDHNWHVDQIHLNTRFRFINFTNFMNFNNVTNFTTFTNSSLRL